MIFLASSELKLKVTSSVAFVTPLCPKIDFIITFRAFERSPILSFMCLIAFFFKWLVQERPADGKEAFTAFFKAFSSSLPMIGCEGLPCRAPDRCAKKHEALGSLSCHEGRRAQ